MLTDVSSLQQNDLKNCTDKNLASVPGDLTFAARSLLMWDAGRTDQHGVCLRLPSSWAGKTMSQMGVTFLMVRIKLQHHKLPSVHIGPSGCNLTAWR